MEMHRNQSKGKLASLLQGPTCTALRRTEETPVWALHTSGERVRKKEQKNIECKTHKFKASYFL